MAEVLINEILAILGEEKTILLLEAYAGCRLYVAYNCGNRSQVRDLLGPEAAKALTERFAPSIIRVPLARKFRANYYRARGDGIRQIAVRLGVSENGVLRIFKRQSDAEISQELFS